MVEERVTDGRRIAELLASELHGRADGPLARVAVVDPAADGPAGDPPLSLLADVEPTADGALACRLAAGDQRLGAVYVQPDRARVELRAGHEALAAARGAGLRARPKAVEPPRTLLFVESGAEVKPAAEAVAAAAGAI